MGDMHCRVVLNELAIGLGMGVTPGVMGVLPGTFRDSLLLGLVVLLTMVTMLVLANLPGMILPFVLTRFQLDPAIASGPLIVSVADRMGLVIHISFAAWLLVLGVWGLTRRSAVHFELPPGTVKKKKGCLVGVGSAGVVRVDLRDLKG